MKRQLLSVLLLMATVIALPSIAKAASFNPDKDIQQTRLQTLDSRSKTIESIQKARLEQLNRLSKNATDPKGERLEQTGNRTADDIQQVRLEHLNTRSKYVAR